MDCCRCEKLPEFFFPHSDIYINIPTHHHIKFFENKMKENNYNFKALDEGYLIRQVEFEIFIYFLCCSVFNFVEQKNVKILPLQSGEALKFSSLKNYRSLSEWSIFYKGKEVAFLISEARIKTLFQPIINVKSGEIYGYEALSRGVLMDGTIINPEELFATAKAMDLLFYLDRVCREASIRAASKCGIAKKLFINFIPTAIYEPSLCLQSTVKILDELNIKTDQVVFEVVETEKVEDFKHLNRILDFYRSKGYCTALDDVGSGYSSISSLLQLKPNYMKIDMDIIRDIHIDPKKQELLDALIYNGQKIGSSILAEGIETVDEYEYLKTKKIDLMQGYLFGEPEEMPVTKIRLP